MDPKHVILTRPADVRGYLRAVGFHPSKSLGQNFLVDANMRDLILDAAEVGKTDKVIEVGPGLGVMTEGLLTRARSVLAIELDSRLARHLQERFAGESRVEIREGDATQTPWARETRPDPVRVVSNLPYSVGSRVLYDLAAPRIAPLSVTVMVQRDVADRLLAPPGSEHYGLLTVRMAWAFECKRVRNVPGNCFLPPPRVDSSVVHLRRRAQPLLELHDAEEFEALVKFAFTRRRKQLTGILRDFHRRDEGSGIDLSRRPETLSPGEWAQLSNHLVAIPHTSKECKVVNDIEA